LGCGCWLPRSHDNGPHDAPRFHPVGRPSPLDLRPGNRENDRGEGLPGRPRGHLAEPHRPTPKRLGSQRCNPLCELTVDKHGLTSLVWLGPARLRAAELEITGPPSRQNLPNLTRLSELGERNVQNVESIELHHACPAALWSFGKCPDERYGEGRECPSCKCRRRKRPISRRFDRPRPARPNRSRQANLSRR